MKESENNEIRRFTLRLTPDENSMIEKLKAVTRENTDTGVIKHLIMNFGIIHKELQSQKAENSQLKEKLSLNKQKIDRFLNAFSDLKNAK